MYDAPMTTTTQAPESASLDTFDARLHEYAFDLISELGEDTSPDTLRWFVRGDLCSLAGGFNLRAAMPALDIRQAVAETPEGFYAAGFVAALAYIASHA